MLMNLITFLKNRSCCWENIANLSLWVMYNSQRCDYKLLTHLHEPWRGSSALLPHTHTSVFHTRAHFCVCTLLLKPTVEAWNKDCYWADMYGYEQPSFVCAWLVSKFCKKVSILTYPFYWITCLNILFMAVHWYSLSTRDSLTAIHISSISIMQLSWHRFG